MPPIDSNEMIEALRNLYQRNKAAKALLDYFAKRQKNMRETSVRRLEQALREEGVLLSRAEIIDVLKELGALKVGRFISGRRGWESRFAWNFGLGSVGRAAAGNTRQLERITDDAESDLDEPAEDDTEIEDLSDALTHTFRLRPDYEVSLHLPADLTVKEAARLAEFVTALPFERE